MVLPPDQHSYTYHLCTYDPDDHLPAGKLFSIREGFEIKTFFSQRILHLLSLSRHGQKVMYCP